MALDYNRIATLLHVAEKAHGYPKLLPILNEVTKELEAIAVDLVRSAQPTRPTTAAPPTPPASTIEEPTIERKI